MNESLNKTANKFFNGIFKTFTGFTHEEFFRGFIEAKDATLVFVGNDTRSLDEIIQSNNSDAVSAALFHKQPLTAQSLDLALKTINPDIVESIIDAGATVTLEHLINFIKIIPNKNIDNYEKIFRKLLIILKAKGIERTSNVLTTAIEADNTLAMHILGKLRDTKIEDAHLDLHKKKFRDIRSEFDMYVLPSAFMNYYKIKKDKSLDFATESNNIEIVTYVIKNGTDVKSEDIIKLIKGKQNGIQTVLVDFNNGDVTTTDPKQDIIDFLIKTLVDKGYKLNFEVLTTAIELNDEKTINTLCNLRAVNITQEHLELYKKKYLERGGDEKKYHLPQSLQNYKKINEAFNKAEVSKNLSLLEQSARTKTAFFAKNPNPTTTLLPKELIIKTLSMTGSGDGAQKVINEADERLTEAYNNPNARKTRR